MDFVPYSPSEKVNQEIKDKLKILRGNGTIVTIEINENIRIPRHDTLLSELPKHYALRDIMSKDSNRKVFLKNLNDKKPPDRLIYTEPSGELIINEVITIQDYPEATANLIIYKSKEPLEDPMDRRFRRSGFLIKGERAIHESTLFSNEFENDPYAQRYWGKLVCHYIDTICKEFDLKREKGEQHPENNPTLLIDPNRQSGLRREHPFTKALFKIPTERLRTLIYNDKEKEREKRVKIENEQTKKRLKKLSNAASKFMYEKVEEIEEIADPNGQTEKGTFGKQGVLIIPTYYTLVIGEVKTFGFRVKPKKYISLEEKAEVTCDDGGIKIITPKIVLNPSPTSEGILTGMFKVQGIHITDSACITVNYDNLPTAEALVCVVESKNEEVTIPGDFAFEKESYRLKEGKKKQLLLRAKYPNVVAEATFVEVQSNCEDIVILKPQACLKPISGVSYAEGYVTVQGRRLGSKGIITAMIHNYETKTKVNVVQAPLENGIGIQIQIRDEDYGNFRAKWDRPHNPNLLLISARHASVKRYLGPSPEFKGQNTPHFKLLLAEIVSENIARKILETLEKLASWEYENMSVDRFYAFHSKLMKEFTPIAHEIQLTKQELDKVANLEVLK